MSNEEELLEEVRKIGEKCKNDLIEASKNPDLDLSLKRREIEERAEKKLDAILHAYFKDKPNNTHLRTIVYESVFTKTILKTYRELTKK